MRIIPTIAVAAFAMGITMQAHAETDRANDDAGKLARGLKAALDQMNLAKS